MMKAKPGLIGKAVFTIALIVFLCSFSVIICRLIDSYRSDRLYRSIRNAHDAYDLMLNREKNEILYDTFFFSPSAQMRDNIQKLLDEGKYEEAEKLAQAQRIAKEMREAELRRQKLAIVSSLKRTNGDFVGWISIEDTNVSYPVVQGRDNSYYLDHDVNRRRSSHGSIFMDFRDDVSDISGPEGCNIVIYGHMMRDGSMFHDVNLYKDRRFFDEHPIITLEIFPNTYTFRVFSTYVTSPDFDYIQTNFPSKNEFTGFLNEIKRRSRFSSGASLNTGDTVLTLSTCGYEFDNARIAVHAKLIK